MFRFFRYKKNGLPFGLITIHEFLVKDIFSYFESSRLMRAKSRVARKAIKAALKFCKKKKAYPSSKTSEAMKALLYMDNELEYTQKVVQTIFQETEKIISTIRQEKTQAILSMVRDARMNFKDHDFHSGMVLLQEAQVKLSTSFLKESRTAIFAGLDSQVKSLKKELLKRNIDH